jgi:hypothetical protein
MQKRKSPAACRAQSKNHHRQVILQDSVPTLAAQHLARRFGLTPMVAELVAAYARLEEPETRYG